ncbi:hypothetical protein [Streptococcus anginosus]|uniref:DUF1642 domain-containing protein n=1 Tax=Streptococcus anginosus TaxID=1328 RepID=A0ABD4U2V0_STRAP|nr:hypothetical protein [Streptococcus anginosus]MCW1075751.1 hypothetical protein [Streptococcus anginosus]
MNKQKAIEKVKTMTVETFFSGTLFVKQQEVIAIIEQIGEPTSGCAEEAPRYLRNILARLRELPEHDRKVWLKGIMGEFERDFSHAKWLEGYKQGKFDGMFGCEKVQIPQYEVSIKASGQYLARTKLKEIAFMYKGACSRFTRKELEEDGFGWVFDCDGVKVQEVK